MIDGTYKISMRMPDVVHDGAAVFTTSGNSLTADFVIDNLGSLRKTGTHDNDEFSLGGHINMYNIGRVAYQIEGLVAGELLKATCETDKGTFDITGSRI